MHKPDDNRVFQEPAERPPHGGEQGGAQKEQIRLLGEPVQPRRVQKHMRGAERPEEWMDHSVCAPKRKKTPYGKWVHIQAFKEVSAN